MEHEKIIETLEAMLGVDGDYDGPSEIRPFVQYLGPIGEVVISFSRLERRLTWALETILQLRRDDANAIQESIISVATRIQLFATLARSKVTEMPDQQKRLDRVIDDLFKANDYRNKILHGPWVGAQITISPDGAAQAGVMKSKYAPLSANNQMPKKIVLSVEEMREAAKWMFSINNEIKKWVLEVFPNAENSVP